MKAKETLELGELLNARIPPMDFYASVCATSGANNRNEGALAEKRGAGQEKKACVCVRYVSNVRSKCFLAPVVPRFRSDRAVWLC